MTVAAAAIAFYGGQNIHAEGQFDNLQLAFAAALAMLAQGWTTSRSSSKARWLFVMLLAVAAVMSFAGFTLFAWAADGGFLMVPFSLLLAGIASWVAGSTNLRILASERVAHRNRRVARDPRIVAGVLGGLLLIQSIALFVGSFPNPLPLILVAIAIPPLYLAVVGKDLAFG
jgi:hypothetical protein